ncbi:MAG: SUF system Fe-S cluster assembly regulator [Rhodospirillales bacterium]
MFRLNRLTDYAVVVLSQMQPKERGLTSAQSLSEQSGVPLPTVAKLLNLLSRDGVVTSYRGAAGGYCLSRPANEISVATIVEAIEGPIALTACAEGSLDPCDVQSICPMAGNWNEVNNAIRSALDAVSLQDMTPSGFGLNSGSALTDRVAAQ